MGGVYLVERLTDGKSQSTPLSVEYRYEFQSDVTPSNGCVER